MRPLAALLTCIALAAAAAPSAAQQGAIAGTVRDSASGEPLDGVRLELRRDSRPIARAASDAAGRFSFAALAPGRYTLVASQVGYRSRRIELAVAAGDRVVPDLRLQAHTVELNPVVVTASRAEGKLLDAPASMTVIDRRQIEAHPALTPVDHVRDVVGVDVAQTGITQHEMVARGFNNAASGALLVLTDYRYANLPSLRINVYNFVPVTSEDVERMEVVRGPGAALYGPNSANGVLHMLTRSPLDSAGTAVSLAGGERSLLQAEVRHAGRLASGVGVKVSGRYLHARDWPHTDPTEAANRASALALGADPDTLSIGRRDTVVERLSGDVRVDWRAGPRTVLVASTGANLALRNVDLTPLGAAQVRDWRYTYAQARLEHDRLFAQAFWNQSEAGNTYLLRSGAPIVDRSRIVVAQLQHRSPLGPASLAYGIDLQRTEPRTGGTITGRNEPDDVIEEAGAYLHSETAVTSALRLIAAGRADWHNRLGDAVLSPRAALVYRAAPNHTLRLTYNRAFATPTTNNLFLDLVVDSIRPPIGPPLPMAVRLAGVPETGYHFRRDCVGGMGGGLCMRSPYTPQALGGPGTWLPVEATQLWTTVLDTLKGRGIDLTAIPQPTPAQVGTDLLLFDGVAGEFRPATDATDIAALAPTITNTIELGYQAVLGQRVVLSVDAYWSRKHDFVGPLRIETPSVFFEENSLRAYLVNFVPQDEATLYAELASQLPLGTVTPEEAYDPWDMLITYRNFGDVSLWGGDLDVTVLASDEVSLHAAYSHVSRNRFETTSAGTVDTVPLNAPADKGVLGLRYRARDGGWHAELRGRAVAGFPVNSGVYRGEVASYAAVDATVGYRLPFARGVTVVASGTNLSNHRHQEFIGAPELGRLMMVRVRAEL